MSQARSFWLLRVASRLVPRAWRDAVREDLREDVAERRSTQWRSVASVLGVAAVLHWTFTRDAIMSDIAYAIRSLSRARWFTLGAVLTFAIGIGVNAAVFAVVDRVLFRPLPFDQPARLVLVHPYDLKTGQAFYMFPKPVAVEARRKATAIVDLAYAGMPTSFFVDGPENAALRLTSASFNILDVLGVHPVIGRGFTQEDVSEHLRAALLREEVWRSRFGGSLDILGHRLADPGGPIEIRGILPAGFMIPSVNWAGQADGLLLSLDTLDNAASRDGVPSVVARLRPGTSPVVAQQQFDAIVTAVQADRPAANRTAVRVEPLQKGLFWNYRQTLQLLFAAAALVWLIACANLGTLMVARGRSREQETAIRRALGASTSRLLCSALAESALVCGLGAGLALVVLRWTLQSLTSVIPGTFRPLVLTGIDGRVIGFSLLGALAGSVLAAAFPIWRIAQRDPGDALQHTSRTGGARSRRGSVSLLVAEAAIGTALVLAGGLAGRSFIGLLNTDLGFSPRNLYDARVSDGAPNEPPEIRFAKARQSMDVLRARPDLAGVTAVDIPPASGQLIQPMTDSAGRQVIPRQILDGYFDVMRTALLKGRVFTDAEIRSVAPVAILSRSAVELLWPDVPFEQTLGRDLSLSGQPTRRLVGIVANTRERYQSAVTPEIFTPADPANPVSIDLLWRAKDARGLDAASLRAEIKRALGPKAVLNVESVSSAVDPWLQDPRLYADLFGTFALVGLVLSAIGLFATTSFDVSLRQYEMGVRMTLGATSHEIQSLVVREAVRPVGLGIAIGLIGALWTAGVFQSLLVQVSARDPVMYVSVAVLLLMTAVAAAWRPARRAARVDPAIVLRAQ